MLELFTTFKIFEFYSNQNLKESFDPDSDYMQTNTKIPISWIISAIIISFATAYIAYSCNEYETPATRALSTIIAFFFSGFYLIYYFIVHVVFDRKCSSRSINNIVKNITKSK
jgi:magnesium-transporting ATPase (P-type)